MVEVEYSLAKNTISELNPGLTNQPGKRGVGGQLEAIGSTPVVQVMAEAGWGGGTGGADR